MCVIKLHHIPTSWQRSCGVAFFQGVHKRRLKPGYLGVATWVTLCDFMNTALVSASAMKKFHKQKCAINQSNVARIPLYSNTK